MEDELNIEIGRILTRMATSQSSNWDYAGHMFETKDGASSRRAT